MGQIVFPKDFLFGTAICAAQAEGLREDGKGLSIWDTFSRIPGSIADGTTLENTCDMYHRYPDDLKLANSLNIESYRFSFAWSRIMPNGKGEVNQKGLDYYKRLIAEMYKNNLVPNATLYHWDLPYELEREGGWLNRDCAKWFGAYAELIFKEFGNDIPLFATLNEPIATYVGYALGNFAPGRKGEKFGREANHHILMAHGEAVKAFRAANLKDAKVGVVVDVWKHHPLRPGNEADKEVAELENEKAYRSYLNPMFKGRYTDALLGWMKQNNCMPDIQEGDMDLIHQDLDFFGLNCYNRVLDTADKKLAKEMQVRANAGGNFMDNGSEYYPKSVYDALHMMHDEYGLQIPIYITENGTYNCNEAVTFDGKIHDEERIKYIKGFLTWIHKAIEDGIDVRGYYVWSLIDNWEWGAGYTYRFGLVHNDFEIQRRIIKDSGLWYKQVIEKRGFLTD